MYIERYSEKARNELRATIITFDYILRKRNHENHSSGRTCSEATEAEEPRVESRSTSGRNKCCCDSRCARDPPRYRTEIFNDAPLFRVKKTSSNTPFRLFPPKRKYSPMRWEIDEESLSLTLLVSLVRGRRDERSAKRFDLGRVPAGSRRTSAEVTARSSVYRAKFSV